MKTSLQFFFACCLAQSLAAQPAPPVFPPPPPATSNPPALREALRRSVATGTNVVIKPAVPAGVPAPAAAGIALTLPSAPTVVPEAPPTAVPAAPAPAATAIPPAIAGPPPAGPAGPPPVALPPTAPPTAPPPASEVMIPNPPPAQPAEEMIPAGTIDWVGSGGADIEQVFEIYAKLTGRTVLRPANLAGGPIKLRTETALTKTEAIQALNSVLALNNISMIPVGDRFVKAVPKAQAGQEGAPLQRLDSEKYPESGAFVTHVVQSKHFKPSELQPLLIQFASLGMANPVVAIDSSQTFVLRDNAENVKRMLELIKEVDVAVPSEFISEVIPIKYAMASEIASALGSLSSGGAVTTSGASPRSGTTGRTGTSGSRLGMTGLQQPGQPGQPMGTPGQPGQPGQPSFQSRIQDIIKKASTTSTGDIQVLGPTKIVADERANALLVFASRLDMATITNIVAQLDVVLPQVLIETIIMDVSLSDSYNVGVSYLQKPKQAGQFLGVGGLNNVGFLAENAFSGATNGLGSLGQGLSYFGRFGQDFDATLTAAASDNRITVIQKPRIMTFHAKPASFFIGSTVPYVTSTSYYGGYGGYGGGGPSSQFQQLRVGIGLDVTPYINQDGLVVMEINQTIEEISGSTEITGVGKVPNTANRTLSAQVAVKDRETIILGGFIRTSNEKNNSGVPILKDIPLLGFLFNKTSRSNDRKELIVLMRPTVLRTPELAAATTIEEKLRLPGISEAERKDREVEERTAERMKHRLTEPDKPRFQDVSPSWTPKP